MAVGYVESHWEQRAGSPSLDNGYGIMHLVDGPGGALERAVFMTGLGADAIRHDARANIEAGAAILSDISLKLKNKTDNKPGQNNNLGDWFRAVAEYSGSHDPMVRDGYAHQVLQVIREGKQAQLQSGEVVILAPVAVGDLPPVQVRPASEDYGPAIWVPANPNNYTVGRPYGPLDYIIVHDTEGSYSSAISWFQNPSSNISAHYVIRSSDGEITQMVREADTAYQAGNWDYNVRAVGIEHEGYENQQGWYTEVMYQSSSALARNIADKYGLKKDRAHIIGHYQVPNQSHTDPGPYWDWDHYMALVRRDGERSALVDNTDWGFAPVPSQIDPAHYWWTYGNGYGNSTTYTTTSVSNPGSSVNSAAWSATLPTTGYYDLYAFIPWVDNNTADTSSAHYDVHASDGVQQVVVSQKAITDVGNGSWAHIGKFLFDGGQSASVSLSDYTGETGRNVWFDAVMWIPTTGSPPNPSATPYPTSTPVPQPTWTPGPCGIRFTDLPDTNWAYPYVTDLFCRGVISGYADGTFRPGTESTRGQFTKMITLGFGWPPYSPFYPTFSDVPLDSPYFQYVETAHLYGVINGYADGTFRPGESVTRGQAAKILVLAHEWPPVYPPAPTFWDIHGDNWAFGYVEAAVSRGIIAGYADGSFRPGLPITRAQLSKMLSLALQQWPMPGKSLPATASTSIVPRTSTAIVTVAKKTPLPTVVHK